MRKQLPSFEELINRFIASIVLRHPETEIDENFANTLAEAWKGKDKQLYEQVKLMERNEVNYPPTAKLMSGLYAPIM